MSIEQKTIRRNQSSPGGVGEAANDLVALGVLQGGALYGGLQVPENLAIVAYDDIAFPAAAAVSITSIHQPHALIGTAAGELLPSEIERGTERRRITLEPVLVVRDSSGG